MSKLISLKLDVSKIDKSKLYQGEKGTYLSLTVAVNDEPNDYGQDVSAWIEQTQEERQNKAPRKYLGNGKTVFSSDTPNKKEGALEPTEIDNAFPEEDNLPF